MRSLIFSLLMINTAYAQQEQQRPYTPFVMDQKTYQAIMQHLGEVPSKYATPVVVTLIQKEQEAFEAKSKENAK